MMDSPLQGCKGWQKNMGLFWSVRSLKPNKILFIIQQLSSMLTERFWEATERSIFLRFPFGRKNFIFLRETKVFLFLKQNLRPSVSKSAGTISFRKAQEF